MIYSNKVDIQTQDGQPPYAPKVNARANLPMVVAQPYVRHVQPIENYLAQVSLAGFDIMTQGAASKPIDLAYYVSCSGVNCGQPDTHMVVPSGTSSASFADADHIRQLLLRIAPSEYLMTSHSLTCSFRCDLPDTPSPCSDLPTPCPL
ncbi:MAG: hypothetical protein KKF44_02620 [Nanoarchaeota archaeon]|nr:hypothetical protein [Nanoarchaeota archaeon]